MVETSGADDGGHFMKNDRQLERQPRSAMKQSAGSSGGGGAKRGMSQAPALSQKQKLVGHADQTLDMKKGNSGQYQSKL